MRHSMTIRRALSASVVALSTPVMFAFAQLPNASPAATGLSGAFTARARGYDAIAWNPANLGLRDNPGFSLGMLAVNASSGLDPISFSDIAPFSGKVLPKTQREAWLQTVALKGGENGRVDGGLTAFAMSAGPVAFEIAGSVAGSTKLNADAFQALMFGNAGLTGSPQDLDLKGSNMRAGAFTTAAASYGLSLGHLALGLTGKYVIGNALAMGQDAGTTAGTTGLQVNFPWVYSRWDSDKVVGSGVGVDAGLAWGAGKFAFGATVQNIMNTFAWDETKLFSSAATALFDGTNGNAEIVDSPYASAPAALRARVAQDKFNPTVGVGVAFGVGSPLVLSFDGRQQMGDGILIGPKTQVSGGVDARVLGVMHLRGGGSYITDGWGASAGFGLDLGGYELGVGAGLRSVNSGKEPIVTLNLLSFR